MIRRRWFGAMMCAMAAVVGLLGFAPTPVTVRDNFNNNSINTTLWEVAQVGGVSMTETNERLEFAANGATGVFSLGLLEVRNWGVKWRHDFEVETRFRLNVNNLNSEKEVALAIGLAFEGEIPNTFTGYAAVLIRDNIELRLWIIRFDEGDEVEAQNVGLGVIQGKLTLEYDRSDDRLEARVGNKVVHLDGIWARHGASFGSVPMVIGMGCSTADGNIAFPGSRVYLDDFEFNGVKQAR